MLRVLTYHRVADPQSTPWLNPALVSALPAVFEQQMAHLAKRYAVLSLQEVLDATLRGTELPRRAVLITFDDAYRDFGEIAWPILRQHRLPATLFVPTGYPGDLRRSFWWDRLYRALAWQPGDTIAVPGIENLPLSTPLLRQQAGRRLQRLVKSLPHAEAMLLIEAVCADHSGEAPSPGSVLSWEELRALRGDGVDLASHSRSHALLTHLPPEQVREEVRGAAQDLLRETGGALPVFCYPAGAHDDTVVRILKEEGVVLAFTVLDGQNNLKVADPLRLRRTNITPRTSVPIFRLRLHRWASYLDSLRHGTPLPRWSFSWEGGSR